MTSSAIDITSLSVRRGSFALKDIHLAVPRGAVVGFAGPNGAGKTTTIKAILGLLKPDAGSVTLLDHRSPDDPATKERIGVVFDELTVPPEWRVETVGRRLRPLYRAWDTDLYDELLSRFDVPPRRRTGDLSRGESVKLRLAMAMAHHPELLVLDEPSTGLDPVSRAELADLLRDWMIDPEHSVLFSTHITSELDNLADYVQVINGGRIVASGQLDELRDRFAVARGAGELPPTLASHAIGLRQEHDRWDALVNADDTTIFDSDIVIDDATIDDIVVYFARNAPQEVDA